MSTLQTTTEREDLLETLAKHRHFLRYTVRDLTREQATERTAASELTLAGLIKHVTAVEANWATFILEGAPQEPPDLDDAAQFAEWRDGFQMLAGESLAGLLECYAATARRTDEIVASVASLDDSHALPVAPWFEPGARWSARRTLLHIIAETAQHAGHADIIRESLDGAKTMG
ncbi:MAG TPA: DinB family protein [Acidimicrobiales bacterium]|nr:DinB family protein [Acidimicrobiales bacterium]